MKYPTPKPFVERELRLSGKFSNEMLINISNLDEPIKTKIVTQYYDDSNYNLLKNGIALRKRSEKKSTLLELKIDRGLGKSLEWASDITKNNSQDFIHYNFKGLPCEGTLKEKRLVPQRFPFQKIVKQSNEVFQTDVLRTKWTVTYKDSIFTICFDEGKILCQTREQLINEIEIEIQRDENNLLLEFFGNLWAKLPKSFYQGRSKALRGFEFRANQKLTFQVLKKPKTISAISFKKIRTELLSSIAVLDYFSCLFCENGGKSSVNCLRNSLLEMKTLLLFGFKKSSIFNKKQLRSIIKNIHRMEMIISPTEKKRNIRHIVNIFQLYKSHTDLLLSLHNFAETLNKFSGLKR
ncbi:CYTH domain-containing protein [Betaproteobacteria bacterium]|nr:CYTH domain-containing protein [Betaproteobacteria bacterium]